MTRVLELFGTATLAADADNPTNWHQLITDQPCPFLSRTCIKVRKSQPDLAIGTCTVASGRELQPLVICPHRLLERHQIFNDCLPLLTAHEMGNELHLIPEVQIPGGNVDYFIVSVRENRVRDFVGVELQTLDTTGTVWPERQRFLQSRGLAVATTDAESTRPFGINWKMTAKTTLVQLHHKVETFEHIKKKLVLVVQDVLLDYMRREFRFDGLSSPAVLADPMHIHAYGLRQEDGGAHRLTFKEQCSTDTAGVAACLGLQAEARLELDEIVTLLEAKTSPDTVFALQ